MILSNLRRQIANLIDPTNRYNKFNDAFIGFSAGGFTSYDSNLQSYIDYGYNINPFVYSMINQMATKTANVPFYVKEIEDKRAKNKLDQLMRSTKGDLSMQQLVKYIKLQSKAYSKEDKDFPMDRPNVYQTWTEFLALYKTFIKTTGNVYLYALSPEEGLNAGQPLQLYLLPSHMIQIVVKDNVSMLEAENPVKSYMLVYGRSYIEFEADKVLHIKYSNPNYSHDAEHLYGQSPLQAALHNIQSSNEGLDLNIRTMKSGGAFGLIHGKSQALTRQQADNIKERLLEMDSSSDRLAKIAGVSAEIGFQRISLTTDELKPFDYFDFDEKQIASCLNWEIADGDRGDFGGTIKELRKQRVVDNIEPDLRLLADAFNNWFLPKFKGYENCEIIFDCMELPEMQTDLKELTEWLVMHEDRGNLNRDEIREAIGYIKLGTPEMQRFTVSSDIISLEEALDNDFAINGTATN